MLVGTVSSHEDREVDNDVIINFAREQNILYFECHTDSGEGIDEVFSALIDKTLETFNTSSRSLGG